MNSACILPFAIDRPLRKKQKRFFLFFLFTSVQFCFGQSDIAIGTWRLHLSYNTVHHLTAAQDKIYGAIDNGVLVFNRNDQSLSSYNSLTGLTGTDITAL